MEFVIDLKPAIKAAKEKGAKRIALQVAEGAKTRVIEWADELKKDTGAEVIIFADPSFGACDLADDKAKLCGCDLLIHVGHSKMINETVPTIYVEGHYDFDPTPILKKLLKELEKYNIKTAALTTTTNFRHMLPRIQDYLTKAGVDSATGTHSPRITYSGQVLGCDYSTALSLKDKVDAVIYFGDGIFHPLGLAMSYNKPTIIADPFTGDVRTLDKEKEQYIRQRWGKIGKAMEAKRFGVLIGTKKGQMRITLGLKVKRQLEEAGKEAYLIAMDFFHPDHLLGLNLEALVSVGCPRIAIDDVEIYNKIPLLTPPELEIMLGKRDLDLYVFDQW